MAAVLDAVARRLGAIRLAAILRAAGLAGVLLAAAGFLAATVFTAPRAGRLATVLAAGLAAGLATGFLFLDAEEFAAGGAARRPAAKMANRVRMRVAVRIVTVWLDYPDSEPFV